MIAATWTRAAAQASTDQPSLLLAQLLHDEVLSEIRMSVLRLELIGAEASEARSELIELEHRLRRRCVERRALDQQVCLAEVVGLHVRRATATGVAPRWSVRDNPLLTALEVQRVDRALSVPITNALQANATDLAIDVDVFDHEFLVTVEDDAGGFDLERIAPDGALSIIRREWGQGAVRQRRTATGSVVSIHVPAVS